MPELPKYIIAALCGVISTGLTVGLPMHARFVAMETNIVQLTDTVRGMSVMVHELKLEVVQLQTINNINSMELKREINESAKR